VAIISNKVLYKAVVVYIKKNKNALKHGYTRSKIYNIFNAMLNRCNNLNHEYYKNYGGRGITVCNRWSNKKNGFENFLEDMGKPPSAKHQIDRIDNNLGYYKENCHWVLSKNNNRNKRNNRFFTYNGKTQCLIDWAKEYKINYVTLWCRIYRHRWLIEKALTVSVRKCEGERNNGKY